MLRECLETVDQQTQQPLEVIVINDGGQRKEALDALTTRAPLKVLHQENRGKSAAVNAALERAQGEFIWIVDDDDLVLPNALETLTRLLQKAPEAGFAVGRHKRFRDTTDGERVVFDTGYWPQTSPDGFLIATLEDYFAHMPGMLVRRSAYDEVGAFSESLPRSIDYDMTLRLAQRFRPEMTDDVLFLQRQHLGQRGMEQDRFDAALSVSKWVENDQRIFGALYNDWPLERFAVAQRIDSEEDRRTALLQRGVIMARKKLWSQALDDWREASSCAPFSLSAHDHTILRRAFAGKYGIDEVLYDPVFQIAVQEFARDDTRCAAIARSMSRGLFWRARKALLSGQFDTAFQIAKLFVSLRR